MQRCHWANEVHHEWIRLRPSHRCRRKHLAVYRRYNRYWLRSRHLLEHWSRVGKHWVRRRRGSDFDRGPLNDRREWRWLPLCRAALSRSRGNNQQLRVSLCKFPETASFYGTACALTAVGKRLIIQCRHQSAHRGFFLTRLSHNLQAA